MTNIKTLLTVSAFALTPAVAMADEPKVDQQDTTAMEMTQEASIQAPDAFDTIASYESYKYNPAYLASAWIGESVFGSDTEEIGDVTDLVINSDNEVAGAVVSVGGVWNIGDTEVIVPISEFEVEQRENSEPYLSLNYTEDEILAMVEPQTDTAEDTATY
jgi:sporulation protein YlmC with PRC-barrel domain